MEAVISEMNVKTIEAFEHEEISEEEALERLLKLGRKQGFVSIDNVLQLVPGEQRQSEQLEEIFEALLSAGIPLIEDEENDLTEAELEDLDEDDSEPDNEVLLSDIDHDTQTTTTDLVRL